MKYLIAILIAAASTIVTANDVWKHIMPHTAVVYIEANDVPEYYAYSTITLVGKGKLPDDRIMYLFIGAAHSLHRNHKVMTSAGLIDLDETFSMDFMMYDDIGRGTVMSGVKEIDPDTQFIVDGDLKTDVGMLIIITNNDLDITPSKFVHESLCDRIGLGDTVYIGSAPCFPLVTFHTGTVSLIPNDKIFMVDTGVMGGASGGGVYNESGEYIGMLNGILCGDFMASIVPMNLVYDFFRSRDIQLPTMYGDDNVGENPGSGERSISGAQGKDSVSKESGSDRIRIGSRALQDHEEEEEKKGGREGDQEDKEAKEEGGS